MGEILWCTVEMVLETPCIKLFRTKEGAIENFEALLREYDYPLKTLDEVLKDDIEGAEITDQIREDMQDLFYKNIRICKLTVNEK